MARPPRLTVTRGSPPVVVIVPSGEKMSLRSSVSLLGDDVREIVGLCAGPEAAAERLIERSSDLVAALGWLGDLGAAARERGFLFVDEVDLALTLGPPAQFVA